MGLEQNIFFEYYNRNEVENFLDDFCKDFEFQKEGDFFVLGSGGKTSFRFEIAMRILPYKYYGIRSFLIL